MTDGPRYTIGVDFGTESARALLVDVADGREVGVATHLYRNGVIDERLPTPHDAETLGPDWALQDPQDYIDTFRLAVPRLLETTGVDPRAVIGIATDFTACTMLPTTADGTPLCMLPAYRANPHAWVKLWKHHAAQPEADDINELAASLEADWLPRYGGRISSEWFFPKALQILREAPEIYAAAERLIEAADWVIWQLTGEETRNSCTAGYKALWSAETGFPDRSFFAALDPAFADVVDEKMSRDIVPLGAVAGRLTDEAAGWTGLPAGIAVAVGNVDAHVSVPAATVTEPGTMVAIMGTSTCHLVLTETGPTVAGMCGVVRDGAVPGLYAIEAGQTAVGDIFAWFIEHGVPPSYHERATALGVGVHEILEADALALRPGESGLLALDWWNGNRSVLVDADLSGLLIGMSLATTPPEIYRALIEATAFGTRTIIDALEGDGVMIERLVACGGLPGKNRLLMQIYADVIGRHLQVAASDQTPALGSAMFAALAAGPTVGGYASIGDAAARMARLRDETYVPDAAAHGVYDELYAEYRRLHDLFGRGGDGAMKTLRRLRHAGRTAAAVGVG